MNNMQNTLTKWEKQNQGEEKKNFNPKKNHMVHMTKISNLMLNFVSASAKKKL